MSGQVIPRVVLTYHRVGDDPVDPHGLQVRAENLEAQLSAVLRVADVVPVEEIRSTGSRPRVAITFDDGYSDNLHQAKPILERLGIPATVFVTSGMVGSREGFWVDRLATLLLTGDMPNRHVEIELDGRLCILDVGSPDARLRAHSFVHGRLRKSRLADIELAIKRLGEALRRDPTVPAGTLPMTEVQLRELVGSGTIAVGSHTVSHPFLPALTPEEQRIELQDSQTTLAKILDRPVRLFAYPYGGPDAYDEHTVEAARHTYDYAYIMGWRPVTPRDDAHRVPRCYVADWPRDEFAPQLMEWLRF